MIHSKFSFDVSIGAHQFISLYLYFFHVCSSLSTERIYIYLSLYVLYRRLSICSYVTCMLPLRQVNSRKNFMPPIMHTVLPLEFGFAV